MKGRKEGRKDHLLCKAVLCHAWQIPAQLFQYLLHTLVRIWCYLKGVLVSCLVFRGNWRHDVRLQLFPRYVLRVAVFVRYTVLAVDRIKSLQDALECSVALKQLPNDRSYLDLLVAA